MGKPFKQNFYENKSMMIFILTYSLFGVFMVISPSDYAIQTLNVRILYNK
jgi:hypothetical protein